MGTKPHEGVVAHAKNGAHILSAAMVVALAENSGVLADRFCALK